MVWKVRPVSIDEHAPTTSAEAAPEAAALFRPFRAGALSLPNRVVMAPMTRAFSPGGSPGDDVAGYYRRRALGGVGLIITEGTWIPDPAASNDPNVPNFFGEAALAGWSRVVHQVHSAGARIIPQLWHTGISVKPAVTAIYADRTDVGEQIGPSGLLRLDQVVNKPMSIERIDAVIQAYVDAAVSAYQLGFDGVELHAAHGYLIDQFFWHETNHRIDHYGGNLAKRTRFAADIVKAIRAATAPDFPILLRFSQWKVTDYQAKLAASPAELEAFLAPLVDAGVDIFDCSQRRYWESEFVGSTLNLAGWTRRLTGRPAITVGSVSLERDLLEAMVTSSDGAEVRQFTDLIERLRQDEFDLVAVGRALLTDPNWVQKVRAGRFGELLPFSTEDLRHLS
jgi:2,4-dienoyl-CoA reductase-like NADH-dependent reductase (Old Yellow Enzyme family)